jgi:hypothetical protein
MTVLTGARRVLEDLHPEEGEDEDRPQIGQEQGQSDLVPADHHRQQQGQAPRHAGDDEEQHEEDAGGVTAQFGRDCAGKCPVAEEERPDHHHHGDDHPAAAHAEQDQRHETITTEPVVDPLGLEEQEREHEDQHAGADARPHRIGLERVE